MHKSAVIGCGYWGPNIVRNIINTKKASKIFVYDKQAEKMEKIKSMYPVVEKVRYEEEIFENPEIDTIFVVTPVETHFELAYKALDSEKHVLVEKPMTKSSLQARKLIEKAKEKNRILMVGHTFEYSPPVVKMKEIIEEKKLGRICFINSKRVNLGIHRKDVSVIWDLASHDFSIIFYWLEEFPAKINAIGRDIVQPGIVDVAFISLEFSSGVIANIIVSWLSPSKLREMAVIGTQKMAIYDDTRVDEKIKIFDKGVEWRDPKDFGEYHLSYRIGDIFSPRINNTEPLYEEINHFYNCVEKGTSPRTDGLSGYWVVKALELCEKAMYLDNGAVKVPLEELAWR